MCKDNIKKEYASNKDIISHYFASFFLYGIALIFICFNPWCIDILKNSFNIPLKLYFIIFYILYIVLAPFYFFIKRPVSIINSKNVVVINYLKRILIKQTDYMPDKQELQGISFYFLRLFFIPLSAGMALTFLNMLMNVYNDYNLLYLDIVANTSKYASIKQSLIIAAFRNCAFSLLLFGFYFISAVLYFISYIFYSDVKNTDTTPLGIVSCLCCYIPFKNIVDKFIIPYPERIKEFSTGSPDGFFTWIFYIIAFVAIITCFCGLFSLMLKSSNLTNRGTITRFPFNIIRHPIYSGRIALWWIFIISIIVTIPENTLFSAHLSKISGAIMYGIFYTIIYTLRAISEERNLLTNDEYKQYCTHTKYKFIPYLW
jgi:protein-S-isoprenylcysteine O-methyltransferase Ste14